jgi:hypothetical protein
VNQPSGDCEDVSDGDGRRCTCLSGQRDTVTSTNRGSQRRQWSKHVDVRIMSYRLVSGLRIDSFPSSSTISSRRIAQRHVSRRPVHRNRRNSLFASQDSSVPDPWRRLRAGRRGSILPTQVSLDMRLGCAETLQHLRRQTSRVVVGVDDSAASGADPHEAAFAAFCPSFARGVRCTSHVNRSFDSNDGL